VDIEPLAAVGGVDADHLVATGLALVGARDEPGIQGGVAIVEILELVGLQLLRGRAGLELITSWDMGCLRQQLRREALRALHAAEAELR
jgi:hypothetical protein